MSVLRSVRPAASALRAAAVRPVATRSVLRTAAVQASRVPAARNFSVSRLARGAGESDVALASRLKEELKYEEENAPAAAEPEFLTDFKKNGIWEISDKEGTDEVELIRTFGNETIKVYFSIADLDQEPPQFDTEEGAEDELPPPGFGVHASVTITKPNSGAMVLELSAEEGTFIIDGISYFPDAKVATEVSPEADFARRSLYIGPTFDNLDVQVQEEFERYIRERGINDELAAFIPDYAEWKEQKEYVRWLNKVTSFVEA